MKRTSKILLEAIMNIEEQLSADDLALYGLEYTCDLFKQMLRREIELYLEEEIGK